MKKLLSMLLIAMFALCAFAPLTAQAKSKVSTTVEKSDVIYVGQSKKLIFSYNGTAVDSSDISWKISKGKKYIKLSGDTIKGKKAGTAVVKATYEDKQVVITFKVKKKSSPKAQTVEVNSTKVKIPANYVQTRESSDRQLDFMSTKKDTKLIVNVVNTGLNDFDGLTQSKKSECLKQLEKFTKDYGANYESTIMYVDGNDIVSSDKYTEAFSENAIIGHFSYELKNIGTIYVKEAYILKGNKEIIVSSVSYDESDCENDIEYVLKNNK